MEAHTGTGLLSEELSFCRLRNGSSEYLAWVAMMTSKPRSNLRGHLKHMVKEWRLGRHLGSEGQFR